LRCRVDPPATVIWRRVGGNPSLSNKSPVASMGDIYSFQEILEFSPVTRKDSATYSCEAKNTIGTSNISSRFPSTSNVSHSLTLNDFFLCQYTLSGRPLLGPGIVREIYYSGPWIPRGACVYHFRWNFLFLLLMTMFVVSFIFFPNRLADDCQRRVGC
jgi:hypothetical protein